jgi:hypothetical protein
MRHTAMYLAVRYALHELGTRWRLRNSRHSIQRYRERTV